MKTGKIAALVVAAGEGRRLGGEVPKQYQTLKGRAVISYALDTFCGHSAVERVMVVIHAAHQALYQEVGYTHPKLEQPVAGGRSRQSSVRLGLQALQPYRPSHVLIHDAARPWITRPVIDRVLKALQTHKAVVPVLPLTDTIKTQQRGKVVTVDRGKLYRAQTPQGFDFPLIHALHEQDAGREATDDAMLAEWRGMEIVFVPGDERNIKITTPLDLAMAGAL
jgi:2-C-methyl-D-erythritol 4-phosphate cytidylyltransferase/2-C-methyl-D-erythritol 2,4-cyclodiphosphate synthase